MRNLNIYQVQCNVFDNNRKRMMQLCGIYNTVMIFIEQPASHYRLNPIWVKGGKLSGSFHSVAFSMHKQLK